MSFNTLWLGYMLDIPQQIPLKYGFSGIEILYYVLLIVCFDLLQLMRFLKSTKRPTRRSLKWLETSCDISSLLLIY